MPDEAPVFVKRTKSKTVASRRTTTIQDDDEEAKSTPISNFKTRNKTKIKPQSRLSFDNDEEVGMYILLSPVWILIGGGRGRGKAHFRSSAPTLGINSFSKALVHHLCR
jgi:hypothetical protein